MLNNRLIKRTLSIIIISVFLLTNLGSSLVYALDVPRANDEAGRKVTEHDKGEVPKPQLRAKEPQTSKGMSDLAQGRKELKEKRGANIKVYEDENGKKEALVFNQDIHYKDNQGNYQEIDNTIKTLDSVTVKTAGAKTGLSRKFQYSNTANEFTALFSGQGRPTAAFLYKGSYLEFSPRIKTQAEPVIKDNALIYPEIMPGVDLEYQVKNSGIKENIILNYYVEQQSFTFDLAADNLILQQEGNLIKVLTANGVTELYCLAPPYMVDADGNTCDQVEYRLTRGLLGYELEVIPAQSWLADPARVYPVRIDPSTNTKYLKSGADAYAEQKYPTTPTWPQDHLYISYDDGIKSKNNEFAKGECITYLQFDTSELQDTDKIVKAELKLYKITRWSSLKDRPASLYRITENKPISEITWNNRPQLSGAIATTPIKNNPGTHSWNITQTVQEWVSGQQANYGLALKFDNNTTQAEVFASLDADGNKYPLPYIAVEYEGGGNPPVTEDPYATVRLEKSTPADHTVTVSGMSQNAETLEIFLYQDGAIIEQTEIPAAATGILPVSSVPSARPQAAIAISMKTV